MLEEILKAVAASGPVAAILLWRLMAADKERLDEKEYNRQLQERLFKAVSDAAEAVRGLNETLKGGRGG
jgi:hypothetical protein